MLFSAFAPLGLYSLSGKDPTAKKIYRQMIGGLGGSYDVDPGSRMEAKCFADSMAIARARKRVKQAADQHLPWKAVEGMPLLEQELGLSPAQNDSILTRRNAATAAAQLPQGSSAMVMRAGLAALLGSDFVSYHTETHASSTIVPTNAGDWPMALKRADAARKIIQLAGAVSKVGTSVTVPYTTPTLTLGVTPLGAILSAMTTAPVVGDVFVFDVGRHGQMDRVTITSVVPPSDSPGTITATFTRPHEVGVLGFTHPMPYWVSTKRHITIVVSAAAASDPVKRNKINDYMKRHARAVSTWDIVEGTSTQTQLFQIGSPSISICTLGTISNP